MESGEVLVARPILRLGALVILVGALSGCLPVESDVAGTWEAEGASASSSLTFDSDGTFAVENFPVSAIGSFPRTVDWTVVADLEGTWVYRERNIVEMTFASSDRSNGYVGPANLSVSPFGATLRFVVSTDDDINVVYTKHD